MAAAHTGGGNKLAVAPMEVSLGAGDAGESSWLNDDSRTGPFWTASAHIITAVIGSGVFSLATMLLFAVVTYYTATLLAECCRTGDPSTGMRNHTCMDAVTANLGGIKAAFCGVVQHANLVGVAIGYTIAASTSMQSIGRAGCFHKNGHGEPCMRSSNPYMILFGAVQVLLSQIPNFDQIWWLSIAAAVMAITYSSMGSPLPSQKPYVCSSLLSCMAPKLLKIDGWPLTCAQSMGDCSQRRVQGQPHRHQHWRRRHHHAEDLAQPAGLRQHRLCILLLQHPHGDPSEGDEEGDEPQRGHDDHLLHAVRLHGLRGVRRCSPRQRRHGVRLLRALLAARRRQRRHRRVPRRRLPGLLPTHLRLRRAPRHRRMARERLHHQRAPRGAIRAQRVPPHMALGVRVRDHTVVALLLPFFGDVVGFLGAISFWPLTVYFPVEMYIKQRRVPRGSTKWICLQMLNISCLIVSVAAAAGSIADVIDELKAC